MRRAPLLALLAAIGCGSSTTTPAANGCGAKVQIAFYSDADCTAQVGKRTYDTSLTCFSWTAMGSSAAENSATRFQCYRDRLCYTQHPDVLTCENSSRGRTDKQASTTKCLKEPDGSLYSKILGGTDGCPEAPAGFECPTSAAMMGTDGIAACHTE